LDYILYQVDKPMVPLSEEVKHIRQYIDLEQIRFHDTLKVDFLATEISEQTRLAPMLLIPLVENAFKHGGLQDGQLSVRIRMETTDNTLTFLIENSIHAESGRNERGIGLENLRKRLELIYKDSYRLDYGPVEKRYRAELKITNLKKIHEAEKD
jgi:LytS/YehU family sensor histidine kinase